MTSDVAAEAPGIQPAGSSPRNNIAASASIKAAERQAGLRIIPMPETSPPTPPLSMRDGTP